MNLSTNKILDDSQDDYINLSDLMPATKSLRQILKLSSVVKGKKEEHQYQERFKDYLKITQLTQVKDNCQQMKFS